MCQCAASRVLWTLGVLGGLQDETSLGMRVAL